MTKPAFPQWFTVLTTIFVVSNLAIFGIATIVDPTLTFDELGEGLGSFPVRFFAARHVAMGMLLLFGLVKKNVTVLTTMYAMFLILSVADVLLLAFNPDYFIPILGDLSTTATLAVAIPAFTVPTGLGLYHLLTRPDQTALA